MAEVADPPDPGGRGPQEGPPGPGPGSGPPPIGGGGGDSGPLAQSAAQRYLPYYKRKQLVLEQSSGAQPAPLQLQGAPAATGGAMAGNYGIYGPQVGSIQAANSPSANPGNPFYKPNGEYSNNQGVQSLIGGGYANGAFNTNGTGSALDLLKHYLSLKGEGDVRQAQLGSELYSQNDPLMGGYARMNAEQNARNNTTMGVAGAQADFAKNNQDHLWALLSQYLTPTLAKNPKPPGAGQYAAQLGGAALGALIP